MLESWPRPDPRAADPEALRRFAALQELVGAIRSVRAEYAVPPGQVVRASVTNPGVELRDILGNEGSVVERLAKASTVQVVAAEVQDGAGTAGAVLSDGSSLAIPLGDLVDLARECGRLRGELERLTELIRKQEAKLANQDFVAKAPAPVVAREREKLLAWQDQVTVLAEKQRKLGCR